MITKSVHETKHDEINGHEAKQKTIEELKEENKEKQIKIQNLEKENNKKQTKILNLEKENNKKIQNLENEMEQKNIKIKKLEAIIATNNILPWNQTPPKQITTDATMITNTHETKKIIEELK